MGSRHENLEDPMAIGIEDMIYVAVGKEVKECKSILLWALQNSGGKPICILHVHQPAQLIPIMGARAPASSLNEEIVREHRETERQKMHEILDEYLLFCRQMGVRSRAQKLEIEMDSIEEGILELISRHQIKRLVMGAAAEKRHQRKMTELKSNKAKYVREHAPISCHIQFICKDRLIFTREASADMISESGESNIMKLRSVTLGHERNSSEIRGSDYLKSRSVAAGNNRYSNGRWRSILDMISLLAGSANEEASSPKTSPSASDHEWDGLRRSPSGSVCSTSSPRRVVDVTLTAWNEANENGLPPFSPPSPASAYSRSSYVEVGSPLMLPQSPILVSSASTISTSSSNGAPSVLDGSLDNTLYEQLRLAIAEVEKEALKRRKAAETDMIEAIHWGQEDSRQRKEVEEALVKAKEELEKVTNQKDQVMEELRISQEKEISLKIQNAELHKKMNELLMERDNALKEAEGLRRMTDHDQFSQFPLFELEEATQKFDESRKIGQGGYGNIYKALLRQKEVAIKMLHSPSAHGTSQFQMEVSVLSQLRHPNLVKLIGSCPEVFALIYEYLPNGNLEDRLSMRDNSTPLSWQIRIRIATELCSVLVYLHSIKPHSIVHGDLKPSNILLDSNFVCKLSDFGICRIICDDRSSSNNTTTLSHRTVPKGTLPYIDPEFLQTGVLTFKSDVYSFGLILLQLLTGRPPFSIANEVEDSLDAGNLEALLDPLAGDWPIVVAQELARLGLWCCDSKRKSRPDFGSDVWKVLEPMNASCAAASSSPQLGPEDRSILTTTSFSL